MKICIKLLTCFSILAFACGGYADKAYGATDAVLNPSALKSGCGLPLRAKSISAKKDSSTHCKKQARKTALKINKAMDATFPFLVPATAEEASRTFASYFAEDGIFQFPGGIARGKDEVFAAFLAYAQNPGEMNQHVIVREAYWDDKKSTLIVERTWFATLTVDTSFCGTMLPAGTTYSQDDNLVIRFECDSDCDKGCILPGKVVYYNEYFNTCQFESNFTSDYPHPCHLAGKKCKGKK